VLPTSEFTSPEITFTFKAYLLIQSEVDAFKVKSFGLYTDTCSVGSLEMIELKINLIDLSVPFAL